MNSTLKPGDKPIAFLAYRNAYLSTELNMDIMIIAYKI